jgi:hypothetical protein
MKTYGKIEIQSHAFLTSALDGREWSPLGRITKHGQPKYTNTNHIKATIKPNMN